MKVAVAIGVVVLFVLVGVVIFYLRRQKMLKRKETIKRYLQEQEVSAGSNWFTVYSIWATD